MAPSADHAPGDRQPRRTWRAVETLGVPEVVVAILEARKTRPWATAAHVSRERGDDLIYIRVALLEDPAASSAGRPADEPRREEVVAGFVADRLGEDLTQAFGQKDVIILK